jgi:hypothetical protein
MCANTMLLAILPDANTLRTVWPSEDTRAMLLVIFVLALK